MCIYHIIIFLFLDQITILSQSIIIVMTPKTLVISTVGLVSAILSASISTTNNLMRCYKNLIFALPLYNVYKNKWYKSTFDQSKSYILL